MPFIPADWASIFRPETPLLVRATVLYFAILVLLRLMPRRTGGEMATMDLVFVVLIAQAATHAFGDYTAVADGIIVITTLMVLNDLVNAFSYRLSCMEWLVTSSPLQVMHNGQLLRREFLTEAELMNHLREMGIESLKDVKAA